jgi:seryl-tRNA synthetase
MQDAEMIDLRAARNDPDRVRVALARKGAADAFDALLAADARWRELVPRVDELRARQKIDGKPTPEQLEQLKQTKEELRLAEEQLAAAEAERDEALRQVPNPPHGSVPDGDTEEDAEELRRWGDPRELASPRDHLELGRFEMERAARLSGARFGYVVGETALLALAVYRLAIDRLAREGFTPMIPPVLVREEAMYGTGFFPTERTNIYAIESDELYLTGTSEVALAGFHMGEILDADSLPLRYCAFSTNFRREAGAAGKDTRGMFRVHQFNKVEMFCYTRPEESWATHDRMLAIEESLLQEVGLPYRVVNVAAGDLGAPAAKKYDCEAWFPSQQRYREVTSCSNTTDYQARRLGIRFRDGKSTEPVHTLNGTAVTDRWLLALLENNQREDGSVAVPEVLRELGAPAEIRAD